MRSDAAAAGHDGSTVGRLCVLPVSSDGNPRLIDGSGLVSVHERRVVTDKFLVGAIAMSEQARHQGGNAEPPVGLDERVAARQGHQILMKSGVGLDVGADVNKPA